MQPAAARRRGAHRHAADLRHWQPGAARCRAHPARRYRHAQCLTSGSPMWTCAKCGERVEDGFEVCWSCGTTIDGVEDPNFFSAEAEDAPAPPAGDVPEH